MTAAIYVVGYGQSVNTQIQVGYQRARPIDHAPLSLRALRRISQASILMPGAVMTVKGFLRAT
jgi:hypothetical protein